MYEAISLERVRQISVVVVLLCILLFIFGWFAWFIGVVAAIVGAFPAVIAFNRCESVQLVATGVHPCGSMLCICCAGPRGELYGTQSTMLVALLLDVATFIVAVWTAVSREPKDWLVTMRVIVAVVAALLFLCELLFMAAFRHAILIHEAYSAMLDLPDPRSGGAYPRRLAVIASPDVRTGPPVGGQGNFPLYEEEDYRRGDPIDPSGPPTGYAAQPRRVTDPFASPLPAPPGPAVRPSAAYGHHGGSGRFTTRSVTQAADDRPAPIQDQPLYPDRRTNAVRVRRAEPFM